MQINKLHDSSETTLAAYNQIFNKSLYLSADIGLALLQYIILLDPFLCVY